MADEVATDVERTHSAAAAAVEEHFGARNDALAELIVHEAKYLAVSDLDATAVSLATAISAVEADRDPLWVMLVGPSSGGKTEDIQLLKRVTNSSENDITVAGLLTKRSGGKGKPLPPSGLLADLGEDCEALVTISDMGSMLSRGGGAKSGTELTGVYDALRDIYDGQFHRTLGGMRVEWHGRITFLAGVTPAIDGMRAHAGSLGTRWVYFRLEQHSIENRRLVARKAHRRAELRAAREGAQEAAQAAVLEGRKRLARTVLSDETCEVVELCGDLAGYGRVNLPRDYQGRVSGAADWEEPGRLTGQLGLLASSLAALGLGEDAVQRIVKRAARSCMPADMLSALRAITTGEPSTYQVAKDSGLHRRVATHALEAWASTGVVDEERQTTTVEPGDDERDRRTRHWKLAEELRGDVITLLDEVDMAALLEQWQGG